MWWMLGAQVGLAALSANAAGAASEQQYKANKKWQKYENTMLRLSDAQNQNAITQNQTYATMASAAAALEIDKQLIQQRGQATVEAAAAGVGGGSVASSVRAVTRSAASLEYARQEELKAQYLGFDAQRRNSAFNAKMSMDESYIPKPSPLSTILGFAKDVTKTGIDNYDYLKYLVG